MRCSDVFPSFYSFAVISIQDWRPQVFSCGLSERLDRFQFVGDIQNIADQSRELLQSVGLWESHGRHFVNEGTKSGNWCRIKPSLHNNVTLMDSSTHVGFQQLRKTQRKHTKAIVFDHPKGSKSKMDEYYTPELLKKVREELYANDFKLWKLVSGKEKMSNGKELAAQISARCASVLSIE